MGVVITWAVVAIMTLLFLSVAHALGGLIVGLLTCLTDAAEHHKY